MIFYPLAGTINQRYRGSPLSFQFVLHLVYESKMPNKKFQGTPTAPLNLALGFFSKFEFKMEDDNFLYRYKYLPFDNGSLCVLKEGTIKYSCPLNFNDPFDCFPYYDLNAVKRLSETRPEFIRSATKYAGLSPAEHIQRKKVVTRSIERQFEDDSFYKELMEGIGVLSLSRNPRNILMWSHYADFHKGFVVEFKIPKKLPILEKQRVDLWLPCLKVNYSSERPVFKYGIDDSNEMINKMMLSKFSAWEYEEEERVVDTNKGPGIRVYNRNRILNNVIAGAKISDKNYDELSKIVDMIRPELDSDVKLFKAVQSKTEYAIDIKAVQSKTEYAIDIPEFHFPTYET